MINVFFKFMIFIFFIIQFNSHSFSTEPKQKLIKLIKQNNYAIYEMGMAHSAGIIDGCKVTIKKNSKSYKLWEGANNYLFSELEVYYVLAYSMTEALNKIMPNAVDINTLKGSLTKTNSYKTQYKKLKNNFEDCEDFSQSSIYAGIGKFGIPMASFNSKKTFNEFKNIYPKLAKRIEQSIKIEFPDKKNIFD